MALSWHAEPSKSRLRLSTASSGICKNRSVKKIYIDKKKNLKLGNSNIFGVAFFIII